MDYEDNIIKIIKEEAWLVDLLKIVRDLELPDWYIAAGAIRNIVWDVLHDYNFRTPLADVDVVYFDSENLDIIMEKEYSEILKNKKPEIKWDVVNQALGHLYNEGRPSVNTSAESIAYWSETSTCVGIRLNKDDSLKICAPHGLEDLMNLLVRPIPEPYRNLELYERRMKQKNWKEIWPKLIVTCAPYQTKAD